MTNIKKSKPIYHFDSLVGIKKNCKNERRMLYDEESKHLIRGKRRKSHLPDSYSDTKFIKRYKSWKSRCKKLKQWVLHLPTMIENRLLGK
jgi:hypothetical protein